MQYFHCVFGYMKTQTFENAFVCTGLYVIVYVIVLNEVIVNCLGINVLKVSEQMLQSTQYSSSHIYTSVSYKTNRPNVKITTNVVFDRGYF